MADSLDNNGYSFDDARPPVFLDDLNASLMIFACNSITPFYLGFTIIMLAISINNYCKKTNNINEQKVSYILGILAIIMSIVFYITIIFGRTDLYTLCPLCYYIYCVMCFGIH